MRIVVLSVVLVALSLSAEEAGRAIDAMEYLKFRNSFSKLSAWVDSYIKSEEFTKQTPEARKSFGALLSSGKGCEHAEGSYRRKISCLIPMRNWDDALLESLAEGIDKAEDVYATNGNLRVLVELLESARFSSTFVKSTRAPSSVDKARAKEGTRILNWAVRSDRLRSGLKRSLLGAKDNPKEADWKDAGYLAVRSVEFLDDSKDWTKLPNPFLPSGEETWGESFLRSFQPGKVRRLPNPPRRPND